MTSADHDIALLDRIGGRDLDPDLEASLALRQRKERSKTFLKRLFLASFALLLLLQLSRRGSSRRIKPNKSPQRVRRPFVPHRSKGVPPSTFRGPPDRHFDEPSKSDALKGIFADAATLIRSPQHQAVGCDISAEHKTRFRPLLQTRETILIVATYSNSNNVLLTALHEITALASFLGPDRVHVAITEGGSQDESVDLLYHLARALTTLGVSYSIRADGNTQKSAWDRPDDRINILAEARNWPLDHLQGSVAEAFDGFDAVLIMNDVVFCAVDALELLYQRTVQDADAVCALDYNRWLWVDSKPLAFYDTWVARTIEGKAFWDVQPNGNFYDGSLDYENGLLVTSPPSKERYEAMLPFQVFACWNGMLAVRAEPLLPPYDIRLRGMPTIQVSESFVFSQDLWMAGFGRIAIAPRSRVGYEKEHYELRGMVNRTIGIDASDTIKKERIYPWQDDPPARVEFYDEHSFWTPAMRPWNWLPDTIEY